MATRTKLVSAFLSNPIEIQQNVKVLEPDDRIIEIARNRMCQSTMQQQNEWMTFIIEFGAISQ